MQPLDETPLPSMMMPATLPAVAKSAPPMLAEIRDAKAGIVDAASALAASLKDQLFAAQAGIVSAAGAQAAELQQQIATDYVGVRDQTQKQIDSIYKKIATAETGLWEQGVITPTSTAERVADLSSGSYQPFAERYAQTIIGTPTPTFPMGDGGLPPPPRPVTTVDTPPCTPDPLPPGAIVATSASECPPGWSFHSTGQGCGICTDPNAPVTPGGDPGPVSPPPVSPPPPPPGPPGGDPGPVSPPPPPPVNPGPVVVIPGGGVTTYTDGCVDDDSPAVLAQCYQLPPPPGPPVRWWVAVDCTDCRRPKACVYRGTKPPVSYAGILQPQVWLVQPTQGELETLARACAVPFGGPPTSPPTSPPAGGDDTKPEDDEETATTEEECGGELTYTPPILTQPAETFTTNAAGDVEKSGDVLEDIFRDAFKTLAPGVCIDPTTAPAKKTCDTWSGGPAWDRYGLLNGALEAAVSTQNESGTYGGKGIHGWLKDNFAKFTTDLPTGFLRSLTLSFPTHPKNVYNLGALLAISSRIETLSGYPMGYESMSTRYAYQFANPQFVPSQADADAIFLTGKITKTDWCALTKMNGNMPTLFDPVMESKAVKPNVNDVMDLYRRGKFKNEVAWKIRMRELGVLSYEHMDEFRTLSEWQPQPPDLIRFMTRDVWDKATVEKYGLDDEFTDKWTADAVKMGKAVGLETDAARLEWRSHWRIPSDTALYAMLHRLRPDRDEVKAWDKRASETSEAEAILTLGERPEVFTLADVNDALKVNDNLPVMVPRLTAISYRPITNTDAARMHQSGFFTDQQLQAAVEDNGYTAKDSKRIADFYVAERARKLSNDTGVWTARKIIKAFQDGSIDRTQADKLLSEKMLDPELRRKTLDGAELEVEVETKRKAAASLHKRYLYGEFDDIVLAQTLDGMGFTQIGIDATVKRWSAERLGRTKEPRVAMLCQWRDAGLITGPEYFSRLLRLGYNQDDAARIAALCEANNTLKRVKQAAAAADKQRRQTEKELRDLKEGLADKIKALKEEYEYWTNAVNGVRH